MTGRRIDQLRYQASLMPLSKDEVRQFGKLSQTATWEKAIAFHGAVDSQNKWIEPETTDMPMPIASETPQVASFSAWVGTPKIFAAALGAIAIFLLAANALPHLSKILPIRINIQIGAK